MSNDSPDSNGSPVKKDVFQMWAGMVADKFEHLIDAVNALTDKVQDNRENSLREFGEIKQQIYSALSEGKQCMAREMAQMKKDFDVELKAMREDQWRTKLKVFALWLGASGVVSILVFLVGFYLTKGHG